MTGKVRRGAGVFGGVVALVGALLGAAPPAAAEPSLEERLERLGQLADVLAEARGRLPRARLELEERVLALGGEAEAVVAWVRDEVRFDAYPGSLRGARGALLAGAGNAWDQAQLAAALLTQAGYQVELARGTLDDAQAEALLAGLVAPGAGAPSTGAEEAFADLAQELAEIAGQDPAAQEAARHAEEARAAALRTELTGRAAAEASALAAAHPGAVPREDRGAWLAEARDYVWVRYRRATGDAWVDAHPAFARPPASLATLGSGARLPEPLPADLRHRVGLEVVLEVAEGGALDARPLFAAWERPVEELLDRSVQVTLAADGFQGPVAADQVGTALARTRWVFPLLDGVLAPGAEAFDLRGFRVAPDVAIDPSAKFFSTLSESSHGALDALGEGTAGDGQATAPVARQVTAAWVEVTSSVPGRAPTRHRRYLLDRVGPAARAVGRTPAGLAAPDPAVLAAALTAQLELVVVPGDLVPELSVDQELAYRQVMVEALAGPLRELARGAEDTLPGEVLTRSPRDLVRARAVAAARSGDGPRLFRSGAAAFLFRRTLVPAEGKVREVFDIVTSPRRAVAAAGDGWVPRPEVVVEAGVRETLAELQVRPPGVPSADSAWEGLAGRGTELKLVRGADDPLLATLAAGPRTRLEEDLGRGFVVLVAAADPGAPSWWRIHPVSGETTGVSADGAGSDVMEYYLNTVSVSLNVAFTAKGLRSCKTACCRVATLAMGIGGFGVGFVLGTAMTGFKAAFLMVSMDIVGNQLLSEILPPPCNG